MFGAYRLLLASMVAASHLGLNYKLLETGPIAVISFFIISGFVMTRLYTKYFIVVQDAPAYYLDRAMRILPQYFFFMLLTLGLLLVFGAPRGANFVDGHLTLYTLLANTLIVPLDFYMFDPGIRHMSLIPQAFTLGLEVIFYLLVPFLVTSRRLRIVALPVSGAIFLLAFFGVIDPNIWGYRLLPGTLIFFLLGMYMADTQDPLRKAALATSYGLFIALAAALLFAGPSSRMVNITTVSTLAGVLVGFPVVYVLAERPIKGWDNVLGNGSYGVFLCHMTIIYWMRDLSLFQGPTTADKLAFRALVLPLSVLVGFGGFYLIERPFVLLRHRMRARIKRAAEAELAECTNLVVQPTSNPQGQ